MDYDYNPINNTQIRKHEASSSSSSSSTTNNNREQQHQSNEDDHHHDQQRHQSNDDDQQQFNLDLASSDQQSFSFDLLSSDQQQQQQQQHDDHQIIPHHRDQNVDLSSPTTPINPPPTSSSSSTRRRRNSRRNQQFIYSISSHSSTSSNPNIGSFFVPSTSRNPNVDSPSFPSSSRNPNNVDFPSFPSSSRSPNLGSPSQSSNSTDLINLGSSSLPSTNVSPSLPSSPTSPTNGTPSIPSTSSKNPIPEFRRIRPIERPPYEWATDGEATVHTMDYLLNNEILTISGKVKCYSCSNTFTVDYNLTEKFRELAYYMRENRDGWNHCAPLKWIFPSVPRCTKCNTHNWYCKTVISTEYSSINWLFLLLGQLLGCCSVEQLQYFCSLHAQHYAAGDLQRLLYGVYFALCKQLDPDDPLFSLDS